MAETLPTTVRRLSAAPPPPQDLIDAAVATSGRVSFGGEAIPLGDMLTVPGGAPGALDPSSASSMRPTFASVNSTSAHAHGASFVSYFTGSVSIVSQNLIVGLSVAVVFSIVSLTSIQHAFAPNPAHLALGACLTAAVLLRFVVPSRLLLLTSATASSASAASLTAGSRLQVSSVFADKKRSFRALALGSLQAVFIFAYAISAARQNMTSMHMNYFSVLPPLDTVLQVLLLRIKVKLTLRAVVGGVINFVPQGLALISRDWTVGFEAIPIAVAQTLWSYMIFLEQAATESTAWLATVYVAFLVSVGILVPVSGAWALYDFYTPATPDAIFKSHDFVVMTVLCCICGVLLLTLFLASGFLIKWSSSAHIVVLVSTASSILIISWSTVLNPLFVTAGVVLSAVAWALYVR
ncbi:hypothetical protein BZA70DRAFT_285886 [Myxozyma melibiosi]|uniref:Uncharacterized protein n=1 Tax=Myxozyma melibiosi TaxID=54550 RepID=A0ABR1EY16_9ASCO